MHDWASWRLKLDRMWSDLAVTEYREAVWNAELGFLKENRYADSSGPTMNIGAGNSPIPADVSCDPLVQRDVVCVGEFLPFRSGTFTDIILFSVLDHVNDDAAVLVEARRALKENGNLYVMQSILPQQRLLYRLRRTASFLLHRRWHALCRNPYSLLHVPDWDIFHMRHYHTHQLQELFAKSGFHTVTFQVRSVCDGPVAFAKLLNSSTTTSSYSASAE